MEKGVNNDTAPQAYQGSKLAWIPFIVVFNVTLFVWLMSFVNMPLEIPYGRKLISLNVSFSGSTHNYIQLAILFVLLTVSLIIPGWSRNLKTNSSFSPKSNYALGLPKGSVRGIIALIAAAAYVILVIRHNAIDDARNVLLLVLAFYFGTRAAESTQESTHSPKG